MECPRKACLGVPGVEITVRAWEAGLEGGLIRVGHEAYGLAGQRIEAGWIEVTFRVTEAGDARRGWVRTPEKEGYIGVVQRTEMFRHCGGGYLTKPDQVEFYREPDGDPLELSPDHPALAPDPDEAFGSRLEVLSVEEEGWLLVRDHESEEFWLKMRDQGGRFQMNYDRGHCSAPRR